MTIEECLICRCFFQRHGKSLIISKDAKDYKPGDLVIWNLRQGGDLPHIGIITDRKSKDGLPMVVHNIGARPELEDMLFHYEITGHYSYGE